MSELPVLVAHHAWLDMSFLNHEMTRLFGFPLRNIVLDTAILDQALVVRKFPFMLRTMKLDSTLIAVAERYHVLIEEQHSSFGDALATAQIFQTMIKQAERSGVLCLKDLLRMAFTPPGFGMQHAGVSGA